MDPYSPKEQTKANRKAILRAARSCGFPRRNRKEPWGVGPRVWHNVNGIGWTVSGLNADHPLYMKGTPTIEELARLWIVLSPGEIL